MAIYQNMTMHDKSYSLRKQLVYCCSYWYMDKGLGLGHMFNSLKTSLHLPWSGLALHSWQLVG
jgi:hypothetical protein